jgi:hypothetical protein
VPSQPPFLIVLSSDQRYPLFVACTAINSLKPPEEHLSAGFFDYVETSRGEVFTLLRMKVYFVFRAR